MSGCLGRAMLRRGHDRLKYGRQLARAGVGEVHGIEVEGIACLALQPTAPGTAEKRCRIGDLNADTRGEPRKLPEGCCLCGMVSKALRQKLAGQTPLLKQDLQHALTIGRHRGDDEDRNLPALEAFYGRIISWSRLSFT